MTDNPTNSAINRDFTFDSVGNRRGLQIPLLSVPERTLVGGLAFDKGTKKVNYSDGVGWYPLGEGGGGSGLNPEAVVQSPIGTLAMFPAVGGFFRVSGLEISYNQSILSSVDNSLGYTRIYFNATGSYIINVTINYSYSISVLTPTQNVLNIERNLVNWYSFVYEHNPIVNEVLASGTFPKYTITDTSQYLTISVNDLDISSPGEVTSVDQLNCCIQITKV